MRLGRLEFFFKFFSKRSSKRGLLGFLGISDIHKVIFEKEILSFVLLLHVGSIDYKNT